MGERYDAVVTLAVDGAVPVVAVPEGGTSGGLAVIRTATGLSPAPDVRPAELEGRLLTLGDLRATEGVTLPPRTPDRRSEEHTSELKTLMRNSYAVFCLKKKKNNKY